MSSISPLTGSIYGGTLVTLTGSNWGTVKTDNPVEIFFNGMPSKKCFVEQTSLTEIKCRLDTATKQKNADQGKMLVFLKTYEEANCTLSNSCMFTFTSAIPEATAAATEWDSVNNKWAIHVTTRDPVIGSAELFIGGKKQVTQTVSGSQAVFHVTDVPSETVVGSTVIWDLGLGDGNAITQASLTLEPRLVSVSPNTGSQGGSLITLNVQGVGPATQALNVVDINGGSVCQSIKIVKYGEVKCLTKVQAWNTALSVSFGGQTFNCVN